MRPILRRILTNPYTAVPLAVVAVALVWIAIRHEYRCDWTGFGACDPAIGDPRPEKTLWDWLDLLIVPAVLAIVGLVFTRQERANENRLADERTKADRAIADQRTADERTIADRRTADERAIADQRFQDETLRTYLDQMTELLLDKGLRTSEPGAEVRDVARVRTLIALRRLDRDRRNIVIQFLRDSKLVGLKDEEKIVNFDHADLSNAELTGIDLSNISLIQANLSRAKIDGAYLTGAYLQGAYLQGAYLTEANLQGAYLQGAYLTEANLQGAYLIGAILNQAILSQADLSEADLSETDLSEAILHWSKLIQAELIGANLRGAKLRGGDFTKAFLEGAIVSDTQLAQASSLAGATLPNGQTYTPPEAP